MAKETRQPFTTTGKYVARRKFTYAGVDYQAGDVFPADEEVEVMERKLTQLFDGRFIDASKAESTKKPKAKEKTEDTKKPVKVKEEVPKPEEEEEEAVKVPVGKTKDKPSVVQSAAEKKRLRQLERKKKKK